MREIVESQGSGSIVYLDESGFDSNCHRIHGWSERGKKIYGQKQGSIRGRTNLIVAKSGNRLLAPVLFEGSTNNIWFNDWLENHLFKELPPNATVIMDNAAFHKTKATRDLFENSSFNLLYLPPYSPDLNPIEQDFAIIKKRRQFAPTNTSLDHIIKSYGSCLK